MTDFETSKEQIANLVDEFKEHEQYYTSSQFDEANAKVKFISKFFKILGWDVDNDEGSDPRFADVEFEASITINGKHKAPDYCFRFWGEKKFFVEAKAPHENIENNAEHAFQLKRYTWSAQLPLGILTDFEEFSIYEPKVTPRKTHDTSIDRIGYIKYTDYVENWEEIYNLFSKEAVRKGKFDNFVKNIHGDRRGTETVNSEFLKTIEDWRLILARNLALRNRELNVEELNFAVQLIIDRIIFLRIAEDRGIEKYGQLEKLLDLAENRRDICPVYEGFIGLCRTADAKYNSGLFHFTEEEGINLDADTLTPGLHVDDVTLKKIIKGLYYPDCPYEFSMISTEILGNIYEQFLGKVIRLTDGHQAKVEDKPLVKKAGGVYYTPQYIVDYIVDNTIGELLKGKTPNKVSKLRFVDPACGSGSFLLGAYQKLLDWHVDYYSDLEKPPKDVIYIGKDGIPRLTIQEKKRILVNNIYGVDIDSQAVEVTKLSLLLKVLEDENKDVLEAQQKLIQERALPYLGDNIRCGNSLISPNDIDFREMSTEEILDINPFEWTEQFSEIFENGGFDAVIGNPPYVNIQHIPSNQKQILKSIYESAQGRFDLYVLFIEKAINLLKKGGLHGFIVPDKLCNQKYATNIRNMMLNVNLEKIVDLRDVKVFRRASVNNVIYILKNDSASKKLEIFKTTREDVEKKILENNHFIIKQEFFSNIPFNMFRLDYRSEFKPIIDKVNNDSIKLKEICYCVYGFQPGNLERFTFNINENPERKNDYPVEVIKKFIRGRNVKPYYIDFSGDYVFYLPEELHRPAFKELFENPKIVISEISKNIEATYDDNKFYGNEKVIHVLPWKFMDLVDENTIRRRGIQFDENNIKNSEEYCLKFILPLLNSKLMQFYFKITLSDDINVYPDNAKELPVLITNKENKKIIMDYCDRMLELNERLSRCNTPYLQKIFKMQIDKINEGINKLIYGLYNLTEDEIKIIEDNV